ncbi:MAG: deoxyhypusine synthase [Candidatus Micrarchaeota archaeon]|nr:deoxyhypusine synthase [Candidatus Micrarchaeota archaeon]
MDCFAMADIQDFSIPTDFSTLLTAYSRAGFQATHLAEAVTLIREMKKDEKRTVFLAFTANLVASGLRGVIADVIRMGFVDAVITTGGSIDHDLIKSHLTYQLGSFDADDVALHKKEINRIGNVLVPNDRYVWLEKTVQPVFKKCLSEKNAWGTSSLIRMLSVIPKDEHSFLKACLEKNVPVFSPAFIDSALGLQLFFFKQDHPEFVLDATADMKDMANLVLPAEKTSAIILGGGSSKHFTIGSNLLRGGLDSAVYFTTAQEYDGSLSGARPKEAVSWGKVKEKAKAVTVYGDATLTFPIAVAGIS